MEGQAKTPEDLAALYTYYASYVPMLRLGRVEELAAAAVFLASDESSFMTGSFDQEEFTVFQGVDIVFGRRLVVITFLIADPPVFDREPQNMFGPVCS